MITAKRMMSDHLTLVKLPSVNWCTSAALIFDTDLQLMMMFFFGSSTEKTDYEEVDCYDDMLIEQEFFANSEEPIEIYYNPKDPSDNDYYKPFDGAMAGGLVVLVGVLAGVSMIIFGVWMLCCGRCCCIE